jgi:hypothetical protein
MLLAAAVAMLAAPAAAVGAPPAPVAKDYEDAAGVTHYAYDPAEYPGATVVAQAGEKTAGGCTFTESGSGAKAAGARVSIATELTFDPNTCTRELATASYAAAAAPPAVRAQMEAQPEAVAGTARARARAAVVVYVGALRVNVELPSQIDVSSTRATVHWSGTASCVNSADFKAYWHWYTLGGWGRDSYSWSHGRNCSRAYANVWGKFSSGAHCWPLSATRTDHSKTWFEGRPRGGWHWSYTVDKSGPCSGLLHYERIITTP